MADSLTEQGYTPFTPRPAARRGPGLQQAAQDFLDALMKLQAHQREQEAKKAQMAALNEPAIQQLFGMLAPSGGGMGGSDPGPIGARSLQAAQMVAPGLNLRAGPPMAPGGGGGAGMLGGGAPAPGALPPALAGLASQSPGPASAQPSFQVSSPEAAAMLLQLAPHAFNLAGTQQAQAVRRDVEGGKLERSYRSMDERLAGKMLDILQKQNDARMRLAALRMRPQGGGGRGGIPMDYRQLKDVATLMGNNLRNAEGQLEDALKYGLEPEVITMRQQLVNSIRADHAAAMAALQQYGPTGAPSSAPNQADLEKMSDSELEAILKAMQK